MSSSKLPCRQLEINSSGELENRLEHGPQNYRTPGMQYLGYLSSGDYMSNSGLFTGLPKQAPAARQSVQVKWQVLVGRNVEIWGTCMKHYYHGDVSRELTVSPTGSYRGAPGAQCTSMQYFHRGLLLIGLFMNNRPPLKSNLNLKNVHLMKRINWVAWVL